MAEEWQTARRPAAQQEPAAHRPRLPPVLPASDPVLMTLRARIFVSIVAARNIALGLTLILMTDRYSSPSYDVIERVPMQTWGVITVGIGVVCAAAAASMSEALARFGVGLAATASLMWAVGFAAALSQVPGASPAGVIVWSSLTLKDYLICAYPMASPFEPIVRRLSRGGRGG